MRPRWICKVLMGMALASVFGTYAPAQSSSDEGKRKVKTKVAPSYPELAKRMNVTGRARIEVIITPDGKVKSTHALGGHPLLVQACLDAVKEWKFVAAPEETTQVVECEFSGNN
jgi:TonB family protein